MVYKSLIRPWSFLGKLRMTCKFFSTSNSVQKYDCLRHAHIIMCSRIWFELSDQGATPPHVTRKVAQNTRPSSHVWGGSGHETNLHLQNRESLIYNLVCDVIIGRILEYVCVCVWTKGVQNNMRSEGYGTPTKCWLLADIARPRSVEASYTNDCMDKVAMGVMNIHGFQQRWRCLAVKKASCDSPCVKLATCKLSLRGES